MWLLTCRKILDSCIGGGAGKWAMESRSGHLEPGMGKERQVSELASVKHRPLKDDCSQT
jgi:hypothetical protein